MIFRWIESGVAWRDRDAPDVGAAAEALQSEVWQFVYWTRAQRGMVWWAMVVVFKLLDNKLWFQTRQSRFVQAAR